MWRRAGARRAATSIGGLIALAVLPKCPLCVAAYLTALGLSASIAALLAPFLRLGALLVVVLALLAGLFALWRTRERQAAPACCPGSTHPARREPTFCASSRAGSGHEEGRRPAHPRGSRRILE